MGTDILNMEKIKVSRTKTKYKFDPFAKMIVRATYSVFMSLTLSTFSTVYYFAKIFCILTRKCV